VTGAYLYELGRVAYQTALREQENLAAARRQGAIPDVVMLLEHEPVITLGSRAVRGEELRLPAEEYARRGIEVVEVPRGGRSTYHGPGQIVAYPILDLRAHGQDLHRYVRGLERAVVATLAGFGVDARTIEDGGHTGVWVEDRKVASIGVFCRRWVTTHGLALNVDLDLDVYGLFDACGLGGARFTSIARETGEAITVADVRTPLAGALADVFGLELERLPDAEPAGAA
jgi:lipoyl(octanoyl) transferase